MSVWKLLTYAFSGNVSQEKSDVNVEREGCVFHTARYANAKMCQEVSVKDSSFDYVQEAL
jgi:hypothetical protein